MTARKSKQRDVVRRSSEPRRAEDRNRHHAGVALITVGLLLVLGNLVWSWGTAQQSSHTASQARHTAQESLRQGNGLQAQATAAKKLAAKVAEIQARQAANRADNVNTWCGALNAQTRVLRTYVSRFPGAPALPLHHLNCQAIVARTVASQAVTAPPAIAGHVCSPANEAMQCILPPAPEQLRPQARFGAHGVDFAWGAPSVATMRSLGATFGASYFSNDPSKGWVQRTGLVSGFHRAGIATVGVWETSANRALAGYFAGRFDAFTARRQAAAVGNTDRPIDFAIDLDASGPQVAGYFQGVHSVLGSRTGAYGGYTPLLWLYQHHLVGHSNWQTYAWSGGRWLPASIAPLEQYLNANQWDYDRAIAADYGQWPYSPPAPKPRAHHRFADARHLHRLLAERSRLRRQQRYSRRGFSCIALRDHHPSYPHATHRSECQGLFDRGNHVNREIARLHARHVR